MPEHFPPNLAELIKLADGTRYEHVAHDEAKLEQLLVEAMRTSADPITREIGSGIADGTMTWHTVATSSVYADYVHDSMDALQRFDFDAVAVEMAAEKVAAEQEEATRREQDELDDDGPLWQGLRGPKR
ncbi:hypothetical protein [Actinokineospora sp.]|uniref:hypothetical protein n=1 Tax=Actinokineospora sp. TaxID=1872133 RepID=UPI0040380EFA